MSSVIDLFGTGTEPDQLPRPATGTAALPNLIGATHPGHLQLAEETMGAYREWQLSIGYEYLPGKLDARHLRELHTWLMQDLYPDVGGTRNDELNYELREQQRDPAYVLPVMATWRTGAGGEHIRLLPAREVNARLNQLAAQLEAENHLMGFDKQEFVERLAVYYIHYARLEPFTSGSAPVLYAVARQLGREAGYEVRLSQAPQLSHLTDAILAGGFPGDRSQLERLLASVTTARESEEAALRRKITMQVVRPKGAPAW